MTDQLHLHIAAAWRALCEYADRDGMTSTVDFYAEFSDHRRQIEAVERSGTGQLCITAHGWVHNYA